MIHFRILVPIAILLTDMWLSSIESNYPYCQTYTYSDIAASLVWCGATPAAGLATLLYQPGITSSSATHATTETTKLSDSSSSVATSSPVSIPTQSVSASGLSRSDQIAIGVGISFGVPSTIPSLYLCYRKFGRRKRNGRMSQHGTELRTLRA